MLKANYKPLAALGASVWAFAHMREVAKTRVLASKKHANNKVTDQSAHPRSLISAIVVRLLESIKSKLVTSKILMF